MPSDTRPRMRPRMTPCMIRRRLAWIPLLLVGGVVYWTVALGVGGLSLAMLGAAEDLEIVPAFSPQAVYEADTEILDEPIVVRLATPDEIHEDARAAYDGPGRTSY